VSSPHISPPKAGSADYLKLALELANIVADSRYNIYEDFVNQDGRRLRDYLSAVRQAILRGLDGGGSDPFRVIIS
jgi:nuclear pore complex protein Nup107